MMNATDCLMSDSQLYDMAGNPSGYCFHAEVRVFGGEYKPITLYTNIYPEVLIERYKLAARVMSVVRYDGMRTVREYTKS